MFLLCIYCRGIYFYAPSPANFRIVSGQTTALRQSRTVAGEDGILFSLSWILGCWSLVRCVELCVIKLDNGNCNTGVMAFSLHNKVQGNLWLWCRIFYFMFSSAGLHCIYGLMLSVTVGWGGYPFALDKERPASGHDKFMVKTGKINCLLLVKHAKFYGFSHRRFLGSVSPMQVMFLIFKSWFTCQQQHKIWSAKVDTDQNDTQEQLYLYF